MTEKPTYEEIESKYSDLKQLYEAATVTDTSSSLENTLQSLAALITKIFNVSGCAIFLWRRKKNQLENLIDYNKIYPDEVDKPGIFYDLDKLPETLHALETNQIYHVQINDPEANMLEVELMKAQGIFESLVLPLTESNQTLGLLEIYDDIQLKEFTKQDIRLANALAFQTAITIKNVQLYESAQSEIIKRKQTERALLESEEKLKELNEELENKIKIRTASLEDVNTALRVLLKKREEDKNQIGENIYANYKSLIQPFLNQLRNVHTKDIQKDILDILESSIKEMVTPFSKKMSDPIICLTPTEIQVASLVKAGNTNKEMVQILNKSIRAVSFHRGTIRQKLGLKNKKINLRTYLLSIN